VEHPVEPFVLIFWQNMTYCSKKHPFSITLKLRLKEIFTKGKTARLVSYRDSWLSVQSADRRLVNSVLNRFEHLRLMNFDCSNEIEFIASHFHDIDISKLDMFEQSIVERILSSIKLVIKNED
jgi:hypothetical protein